jgi:Nuclease-related domain
MIGKSIYVPDNPAFVGGSPQAVHEQLWAQGRRRRLQTRGALAAAGLVIFTWLADFRVGLLAAVMIAAADTAVHWHGRAASSVWRRGQRGERRTARVLRLLLEWRGYDVVHGRNVPGYGPLDHLVIGPAGVTLVDNNAVSPETELTEYRGVLYIDDRSGAKMAATLRETARATAAMLAERLGRQVTVEPVVVVYGGRLRRGGLTAEGITFLRAHELPGWIRRRPPRYPDKDVAAIHEAAHMLPISRQATVVR